MRETKPFYFLSRLAKRAVKALKLLTKRSYRRGMRQGVAAAIEHEPALTRIEASAVVDVGANKGQFALVARRRWPTAPLLAFEPIQAAADRFEAVFRGDKMVRLHRCAVGENAGSGILHLSKQEDSSSLLPVGAMQSHVFPGTEEKGTAGVPVIRLRDVIERAQLGQSALLKIDVQGYELQVLKGAGHVLDAFRYVYAECSYLELYEGQALAAEVIAYLRSQGFEIAARYNAAHTSEGKLVQADLLFERRAMPASA